MQASRASTPAGLEHFVRVTRTDRRGYIEFEYAIGDPALHLDMILPPEAFTEFCSRHQVVRLPALQAGQAGAAENPHVD